MPLGEGLHATRTTRHGDYEGCEVFSSYEGYELKKKTNLGAELRSIGTYAAGLALWRGLRRFFVGCEPGRG